MSPRESRPVSIARRPWSAELSRKQLPCPTRETRSCVPTATTSSTECLLASQNESMAMRIESPAENWPSRKT